MATPWKPSYDYKQHEGLKAMKEFHVSGLVRIDLPNSAPGDMLVRGSDGLMTRLAPGSLGQVLGIDAQTGMPKWVTGGGGGIAEEEDPLFASSPSSGITVEDIDAWDEAALNAYTAVGWGNHALMGYLTSFTESDPSVPSHVKAITQGNIASWNTAASNATTALGWGNHANAGYLTSYSESDPVFTQSAAYDITTGNKSMWGTVNQPSAQIVVGASVPGVTSYSRFKYNGTAVDLTSNGNNTALVIVGASSLTTKPLVSFDGPVSTDMDSGKLFSVGVPADTYSRGMFYSDGSYAMGGGTTQRDAVISRAGASLLKISSDRANGAANLLITGLAGTGTRIVLSSSNGTLSQIANGTDGQVLKLVAGTPTWSTDLVGAAGTSFTVNNPLAGRVLIANATTTSADASPALIWAGTTFTVGGVVHAFDGYGVTDGQLRVTTKSGATNVVFNSAGDSYILNSVGIGTITPNQTLDVRNLVSMQIRMGTDGGARPYWQMGRDNVSTGAFVLTDETSGKLWILNNGNVGIGVSAPEVKLHVAGHVTLDNTTTGRMSLTLDGSENRLWSANSGFTAYRNFGIYTSHPTTPTMYFRSDGNVAVGSTSTGYKLGVSGSIGSIAASTLNGFFLGDGGADAGTFSIKALTGRKFSITDEYAGVERVSISSTGVVTIASRFSYDGTLLTVTANGQNQAVIISGTGMGTQQLLRVLGDTASKSNGDSGKCFGVGVQGGSSDAAQFYSDGAYIMGDGTAASTRDVSISRSAANTLLVASAARSSASPGSANIRVSGQTGTGNRLVIASSNGTQSAPTALTWTGTVLDVTGNFKASALAGSGIRLVTASSDGTLGVTALPSTSAWTTVIKTGSTSRASITSLAADPELKFSLAVNTSYVVRVKVFYDCGATEDIKYGFNGPASPSMIRVHRAATVPSGTGLSPVSTGTSYDVTGVGVAGSGTQAGFIQLDFLIYNGPNTGFFEITWAQNTSGATNTTVLAGSYVEYAIITAA